MRVLHVINRFSRAGAETSLREFVLATADQVEHGICVLNPDRNDFAGCPVPDECLYVPERVISRLGAVRHVRAAIRGFDPDMVHTVLFDADTAGRLAAMALTPPVLTSRVSMPYTCAAGEGRSIRGWKRWTVRQVDRMLSRHATDHFHAITHAVAVEFAQDFKIDLERITVVPRGRDRERLGEPSLARRTDVRNALTIAEDEVFVLTIGRQEAQKGHRHLLHAAPLLLAAHPNVRICIAGRSGAVTPELERLHDELQLGGHVRFLGFRDDIGPLLDAADVFAFPSLCEGLGGAVLEAMAMEVPIVASDLPALREVLAEGLGGKLVPAGDHRALAEAISSVITDPVLRRQIVAFARQRYETEYNFAAVTQRMLDLYERVVGR